MSRMPPLLRAWMRWHHDPLTRRDWAAVGDCCVVVVCAGAALLYVIGVIR